MQVQTTLPPKSGALQDALSLGFQKLPVISIVLHNDTNYFFIGFFPCFFYIYIFKRQYLLYCEFAVEDA